jgi:hypothetical protein
MPRNSVEIHCTLVEKAGGALDTRVVEVYDYFAKENAENPRL